MSCLPPTSVSVGICAYTEVESTIRLVDYALAVTGDGFRIDEVIVATPNLEIARRLRGKDPRVELIEEAKREGKVIALNKILARAKGDIFVHASADVRFAHDSISNLVRELTDHPGNGAIVAHVKLANPRKTLMDKVSVFLWSLFNNINEELNEEWKLAQAGDLYAFRRELVTSVPGDIINDDSYIALQVRDQGYHVKKARRATVFIGGPRSPVDYVAQRSRILTGHMQIVSKKKEMPTTFEFTLFSSPRRNLGVLARTFSELGPSHILPFFTAVPLEMLSLLVAAFSHALKRRPVVWRVAPSTKEV